MQLTTIERHRSTSKYTVYLFLNPTRTIDSCTAFLASNKTQLETSVDIQEVMTTALHFFCAGWRYQIQ